MMQLGEIASITRGITTGLNKYFIFEKINKQKGIVQVKNGYERQCKIESKYLKPFLVGPKRMLNSILNQEASTITCFIYLTISMRIPLRMQQTIFNMGKL